MMSRARWILLRSLLALSAWFGLMGCAPSESIEIDAPIESVWNYLGNNAHASEWSVYFKSIRTLSTIGNGGDTAIGTVRRCYRGDDESSPYWDELTVATDKPHYRRILTYNFQGYQGDAFKKAQFFVGNTLTPLTPTRTRLTFSNEMLAPKGLSALFQLVSHSGAARQTLRDNLENIKMAVEAEYSGTTYTRLHRYLELGEHKFDSL